MAEIINKVKPYILISLIIVVFNIIGCIAGSIQEYSINNPQTFSFSNGLQDGENVSYGSVNSSGSNWVLNLAGTTGFSFLPFASLIFTVTYPEPINFIFSLLMVILSALQVFIIAMVILNVIPFTNL